MTEEASIKVEMLVRLHRQNLGAKALIAMGKRPADPDRDLEPGEVVEVPKATAERWIQQRLARLVPADPNESAA